MEQYNEAIEILTPILTFYNKFSHASHGPSIILYFLLLRILGKRPTGQKAQRLDTIKITQDEGFLKKMQDLYTDLGRNPELNDSMVATNQGEYEKDLVLGLVKKTTAGAVLLHFKGEQKMNTNSPIPAEWANIPLLLKAQKVKKNILQ